MSTMRYLHEVVTLVLHEDKCTGCGMCVIVCPRGVFEVTDGKASIADRDACIECGACSLNCPVGAIDVDKGVGCASAVLEGAVRGSEPRCCCGGDDGSTCGRDGDATDRGPARPCS